MKVLMECGLVECRREGTWSYYKLNKNNADELIAFLTKILNETDQCICNK